MYPNFQCCGFSFFPHHGLDFFLCFFNHFLNSGRMDTAIYNQFFQSDSGYFSADWIKSGKHHCLRRIINDQIHSRQSFQGSDITAFTTNDPSLHLIAWKLYNRNCSFCHMVCCTFLYSSYYIFFCLFVRVFSCPALQFLVKLGGVNFHFIFNSFQQIIFCLFGGKT